MIGAAAYLYLLSRGGEPYEGGMLVSAISSRPRYNLGEEMAVL